MVTYPVIIGIGLALLAGARFRPPWYWLGMNAGTLFGVGFCTWLQYQSLYNINSLCLWCCLAWVATILMFCYVTTHNIRHGIIPAPSWLRNGLTEFHWVPPGAVDRHHRHAHPHPLVGLLDQLTRSPGPSRTSGPDDRPGGVVSGGVA